MNLLDDTNQNDQVQIDESKDYFAELTAPGAKFDLAKHDGDPMKAAAAIAKGKWHADATLEHRNKSYDELRTDWMKLREEYNAGPKLKEYLDQLVTQKSQNEHQQTPVIPVQPVQDSVDIEKLLEQKLTAREQQRKEEANYKLVETKLTEHYGPQFASVLKQQVDQLGLDKDFVNDLARKHPAVLFRTLGIEGQKTGDVFQSPPTSSQRRDPFASATKRTNAYYQKLRKEKPVEYRSPKIQDQMLKDAIELGDEFNDGDWNAYGH
jgi:hypothetical protein